MRKPFTNCILGVNISITNMQEMINIIMSQLDELKGEYVCFSNVHTTVMAYEDAEYRHIQNSAFVALPDGSPLSYVQRMRGHEEAQRVAGPDFMSELWKATEDTEVSHYFYGASESTIESLRECLEKKYPNLKIAGMESPPFRPLTAEEDEAAIKRINESGADILWVGLGAPKQEKWMYEHRGKINAVMMGVGAGFDFHAGIAKRAPMWMQTHYLEWLYRLTSDPKRLWKRYVTTNGRFVFLLAKYAWRGQSEDQDKSLMGATDKKNLLIYAHYYYPDVASTGQILTELAEGLKDSFNITVICTVPSYDGRVARKYRPHKYFFENINGVNIMRLRVPEFRKSFPISRIYNISQYFISAIIASFHTEKMDYVYTISQPPVLGGLLGVVGKYIKRAKFIYNIQDFNPEQVKAVKFTKMKLVTDMMMALDKFSCKKADKIIFVGRDMEETLLNRFSSEKERKKLPKYTCINNWIDEKAIVPLDKDNEGVRKLKREYDLEGKFIFMYSGNIGLYYDLMNIIKVIERFKERQDVLFLFAGDGSVLKSLKKYVNDNSLKNVRFMPYQDKKKLTYSLNLGDVHFVVNAQGIKGVSVPSKLYGVMAAGKPVFGILEEGTEARCIIEESECGKVVNPGDYEGIERLINDFIENKNDNNWKKMGGNGREFLINNLRKDISIEKYRKEILDI